VDDEEILPPRVTKPSPTGPMSPVQPAKPGDDEEIARLKDALANAESQISQLKLERTIGRGPGEGHELHARPLGPNMMPGQIRYILKLMFQTRKTVNSRERRKCTTVWDYIKSTDCVPTKLLTSSRYLAPTVLSDK
jgi:hypothetical protein